MTAGQCPNCQARGAIGAPCVAPSCAGRGLHHIPLADAERGMKLPASQVEPLVGTMIGDFLIVQRLGKGGFGRVLLGLQRPLFRLRGAVKLLEVEATTEKLQRVFSEKFENEARTLAILRHPNIVGLLQYGTFEDRSFLAMEYIPGSRTLSTEIGLRAVQGSGLDPQVIRRIMAQTLRGLEAAHREGIIHRDLKPDNIMLEEIDGDPWNVKIVDFGLAKVVLERRDTSMVMGTFAYMAPEQLDGRNLGAWTDLYAVGVILFELVTGRRLFSGPADEVLGRKRDPDFDPVEQVEDLELPLPVTALLRRALAFEPTARFQSAAELREALELVLSAGENTSAFQQNLSGLVDRDEISKLRREGARIQSERLRLAEEQRRLDDAKRRLTSERQAIAAHATGLASEGRSRAGRGRWWAVGVIALVLGGGAVAVVAASGGAEPVVAEAAAPWIAPAPEPASPKPEPPKPAPEPASPKPEPASPKPAPAPEPELPKPAAEPAPPKPAPEPAAPEPPQPVVKTWVVRLASDPPGATVTRDGQVLGTTPVEIPRAEGEPAPRLTLSLRGHEDAAVVADVEGDLKVVLKKKRRPGPRAEDVVPKW
ncbi:MAG: serine/threonine protein kinase [Deltaproteobacteria bacterium]|nr:serine/threonine protein kinase [Deltaproteobacteria bacterium]